MSALLGEHAGEAGIDGFEDSAILPDNAGEGDEGEGFLFGKGGEELELDEAFDGGAFVELAGEPEEGGGFDVGRTFVGSSEKGVLEGLGGVRSEGGAEEGAEGGGGEGLVHGQGCL